MPVVYQVQQTGFFDKQMNRYRSFDVSSAQRFGDIVTLLPSKSDTYNFTDDDLCDILHDELSEFTADDFLLPMGDPIAIVAAASIAGERADGQLKVLKWDKRKRDYFVSTLDV